MPTYLIRLISLATLGAALVGCGTDTEPPPTTGPSPGPASRQPAGPERPAVTPVFLRAADPTGTTAARTATKTVALTFDADMTADQGPRAARGERFDNPTLISSLRRLEVPSTIFMTGRWVEEYPSQAREIGSDPLFEVANHSYSHHSFTADCHGLPALGTKDMAADVERAFGAFRKAGVRQVVPYFRFPGGCYDQSTLRTLAPAGLTAVQWDVVSGDAFATDADVVAEQVLAEVRPGSVVVMHCTMSAAPVTDDAVRKIVPALRERGYRFVKVSELMKG
ncbi:polysaccharide deacetylase family protein [Streptomyces sp. NP-1717]|uniref:polysaccharide deacetylase family protein n=1 Tax=Streptomyces sp. NP-1717 TaxID=2704470 RepID=UPI001F5CAEB7|nr:polysaccharide deacetylase family protein [Streptomyces sp. NP-1717]MCI3224504.1 polysaccharide deacetylase family protein [Streptomyces sp. NP-1717]